MVWSGHVSAKAQDQLESSCFHAGRAAKTTSQMLGKNFLFYTVASTIIAVVAQALGADIVVVLVASLIGPPVVLMALAFLRYNGWL